MASSEHPRRDAPLGGARVTPPCRKPVIVCPVGAAVETLVPSRQCLCWISPGITQRLLPPRSLSQAVRLQDRGSGRWALSVNLDSVDGEAI